jgi:hypothetical protein
MGEGTVPSLGSGILVGEGGRSLIRNTMLFLLTLALFAAGACPAGDTPGDDDTTAPMDDDSSGDDDVSGDDDSADDDDDSADDDDDSADDDDSSGDDDTTEDQDGDGWTVGEGDCDDFAAESNPAAAELCDGEDDDCDGLVDEDCVECDREVPADVPTIQLGLDAAVSGEVICVAPGTYQENVGFNGTPVHLLGVGGPGATTIQAAGPGSVVVFPQGETQDTVLEGFTLTQGVAGHGGGIHLPEDCSPTLRNLNLRDNESPGGGCGGGAYLHSGSPIFERVTFENNTAEDGGGLCVWSWLSYPVLRDVVVRENTATSKGGGLYFMAMAEPTIERTTIVGNSAAWAGGLYLYSSSGSLEDLLVTGNEASEHGGGAILYYYSSPTMTNVAITDNTAGGNGGGLWIGWMASPALANVDITSNAAGENGGGIYLVEDYEMPPAPSLANVVVAGNDAGLHGGGLFVEGEAYPALTQVTFVGNGASGNGGALALYGDANPSLVNVTLTANTAAGQGGGLFEYDEYVGSAALRYSNNWGNSPDDYAGMADPTGADGNLSADPAFLAVIDPDPLSWDLHLSPATPLVDAGDPAIQDPDGSSSDLGAYGGPDAAHWDQDWDGFDEWWLPGVYDPLTSPGMDCDDADDSVYPGSGC